MRRHDKPSGKTAKPQRRGTLRSANIQRISSERSSAAAANETDLAGLIRERDEALQQQVATSEVLGIIRRSPANAQPVFDAIVESAARLCVANFCILYLYSNDRMRIAATSNFNSEATGRIHQIQELKRPERSHLAGRAILDRAIVHVQDVLADPEYSRELALAGGWRAVLSVPLLREGAPVGALSVGKAEPTPFSDRQIRLLNTFADQALIAIENTRLLNELREFSSSRPPLPTCSKSSVVRPANLSQSLRPCWRTPCACVRRNSVLCIDAVAITGKSRLNMARYQPTPTSCDAQQGQDLKPLLDASRVPDRWFRSPTSQGHEVMPNAIH